MLMMMSLKIKGMQTPVYTDKHNKNLFSKRKIKKWINIKKKLS